MRKNINIDMDSIRYVLIYTMNIYDDDIKDMLCDTIYRAGLDDIYNLFDDNIVADADGEENHQTWKKWAMISYYSESPDNPLNYNEADLYFIEDLFNLRDELVDWLEIDADDEDDEEE